MVEVLYDIGIPPDAVRVVTTAEEAAVAPVAIVAAVEHAAVRLIAHQKAHAATCRQSYLYPQGKDRQGRYDACRQQEEARAGEVGHGEARPDWDRHSLLGHGEARPDWERTTPSSVLHSIVGLHAIPLSRSSMWPTCQACMRE